MRGARKVGNRTHVFRPNTYWWEQAVDWTTTTRQFATHGARGLARVPPCGTGVSRDMQDSLSRAQPNGALPHRFALTRRPRAGAAIAQRFGPRQRILHVPRDSRPAGRNPRKTQFSACCKLTGGRRPVHSLLPPVGAEAKDASSITEVRPFSVSPNWDLNSTPLSCSVP